MYLYCPNKSTNMVLNLMNVDAIAAVLRVLWILTTKIVDINYQYGNNERKFEMKAVMFEIDRANKYTIAE